MFGTLVRTQSGRRLLITGDHVAVCPPRKSAGPACLPPDPAPGASAVLRHRKDPGYASTRFPTERPRHTRRGLLHSK